MKFDRFISFIIFQQIRGILLYHRGKRFRITQRGIPALNTYTKIDDLWVRKTLHKTMNRSERFGFHKISSIMWNIKSGTYLTR
jgi:hypothetical protein